MRNGRAPGRGAELPMPMETAGAGRRPAGARASRIRPAGTRVVAATETRGTEKRHDLITFSTDLSAKWWCEDVRPHLGLHALAERDALSGTKKNKKKTRKDGYCEMQPGRGWATPPVAGTCRQPTVDRVIGMRARRATRQ